MFKSAVNGVAFLGVMALLPTAVLAGEDGHRWTGPYVGVNVGYAWGDADLASKVDCIDNFDGVTCPYPRNFPGFPNPNLTTIGGLGTGSVDSSGFTGGVQVGYNKQSGTIVYGFEADLNRLDLGGSQTHSAPLPEGISEFDGGPQVSTVTTSFDTEWMFTLRGRLGVLVAPSLLAYVTGGFALADIKVTNRYSDTVGTIPGFEGLDVVGASSNSKLTTGWTIGGGGEWALDENWSIKGEYLYTNFGTVKNTGSFTIPEPLGFGFTPNTFDTSAEVSVHQIRAGLNYKF